jgi:L-threonylcarbamoyladenylate synthase
MQNPTGAPQKRAKIIPPTPEGIALAAEAIRREEVVGMPTETVYGLAGDARSLLALTRIFETKERPTFDPLIIHVGLHQVSPSSGGLHGLEKAHLVDTSKLSQTQKDQINLFIREFWPGPLTLILPKHADVPDLATSGLSTVAIRMPLHPVAQALISASQTCLAAPSANRFGRISPTSPEAVSEELGDRIDWILDGGPSQIGLESTILGMNDSGEWMIFRQGGTPQEQIEKALGMPVLTRSSFQTTPDAHAGLQAPGMLASHYAPRKPLYLIHQRMVDLTPQSLKEFLGTLPPLKPQDPIGLLVQAGDFDPVASHWGKITQHPGIIRILSPSGDLQESARHLFSEMRALDSSPAQILLAEFCYPSHGLGHGIADRLRRASYPKV